MSGRSTQRHGEDHQDALADRYTPYRADRPPGPVVAVTPRRWAWWSAS